MQKDKIIYTVKHRKAFRRVEKELLGHNTLRGILHDLDKVFLYMILIINQCITGIGIIPDIILLRQRHIVILSNGSGLGMCKIYKARQTIKCERDAQQVLS